MAETGDDDDMAHESFRDLLRHGRALSQFLGRQPLEVFESRKKGRVEEQLEGSHRP